MLSRKLQEACLPVFYFLICPIRVIRQFIVSVGVACVCFFLLDCLVWVACESVEFVLVDACAIRLWYAVCIVSDITLALPCVLV